MNPRKLVLAGLLIAVANTCVAQPVGAKPPPATATLPAMPPQLGTATDHEITKLRYELAKVKADLTADVAKLKADLIAQAELQKTQTNIYEGHTHKIFKVSFDLVPTKAKCFDSSVCKNDIFYDKISPTSNVVQASKPLTFTNQGSYW